MRKRAMTPMERASALANRRIPKAAQSRHTRLSDFMHGYEAGWNAARKPVDTSAQRLAGKPGEGK